MLDNLSKALAKGFSFLRESSLILLAIAFCFSASLWAADSAMDASFSFASLSLTILRRSLRALSSSETFLLASSRSLFNGPILSSAMCARSFHPSESFKQASLSLSNALALSFSAANFARASSRAFCTAPNFETASASVLATRPFNLSVSSPRLECSFSSAVRRSDCEASAFLTFANSASRYLISSLSASISSSVYPPWMPTLSFIWANCASRDSILLRLEAVSISRLLINWSRSWSWSVKASISRCSEAHFARSWLTSEALASWLSDIAACSARSLDNSSSRSFFVPWWPFNWSSK